MKIKRSKINGIIIALDKLEAIRFYQETQCDYITQISKVISDRIKKEFSDDISELTKYDDFPIMTTDEKVKRGGFRK